MEEILFYTTITLTTEDIDFTFVNFPCDLLREIGSNFVNDLLEYKWYLKGNYDRVELLGTEFTITAKTKKKVTLLKSN